MASDSQSSFSAIRDMHSEPAARTPAREGSRENGVTPAIINASYRYDGKMLRGEATARDRIT
jgi:hypothetical protein